MYMAFQYLEVLQQGFQNQFHENLTFNYFFC